MAPQHHATIETQDQPIPYPIVKAREAKTDLLFVYGTLMRGQSRNGVLAGEEYVGEAYVTDAYLCDTGFGFPALILGKECDRVVWGEVYRIRRPEVWVAIDRLENGLYDRRETQVHLPAKPPLTRHPHAYTYVWNREYTQMELIPGGRWSDVRA